jgi:hypothetical protein
LFGVNFADGRIKGYGLTLLGSDKTFFVIYVRGNTSYGQNSFADNGDGTISDNATGLMWAQNDSGMGLNWEEALTWVEARNAANYLGYSDWRLPDAKELQSIVDYARSPDTTDSAAIDPLFNATSMTNEAEQTDYPCYWSNTTHANIGTTPGANAAYIGFGRAMGYMNNTWVDVHGAGAQRSDPKFGDPNDYPTGRGPQGDAIRIYNYGRLVRDISGTQSTDVYVNQNDGTCGGNTPCYSTIQAAIDAAETKSIIRILQGTFDEHVIMDQVYGLTLSGGWDSTFTTQSSNTVINSLTINSTSGTVEVDNVVLQETE